jgi:putative PIN family toxin of toxin-antitoxin system
LIVFDASTLVGAVLKADSIPERALLRAQESDVLALSTAIDCEIAEVLSRPKFARAVSLARRERFLEELRRSAIWFEPSIAVNDCRHAKDDKYLELALAAGANPIVSSDADLLVLHPWRGIPVLSPADFLARADEVIE